MVEGAVLSTLNSGQIKSNILVLLKAGLDYLKGLINLFLVCRL